MENKYKLIVDSFGKDRFKFNESLKDITALKIGGPAKLFFIAFTNSELIKVIKMCRELRVPFFLIGTGSKVMISDLGFDGLVIKNRTKNIQTVSVKGKVTQYGIGVEEALIEVDGGVSIAKLCEYLNSQELAGEDISGIPGTLGGNLPLSRFLQMKVKSIKVLDYLSEIDEVSAESLRPGKQIILTAVLRFKAKKL